MTFLPHPSPTPPIGINSRVPAFSPKPEQIAASQMSAFAAVLEARTGLSLSDYARLHEFSVREYRTFWRSLIEWCADIQITGEIEPVCVGDEIEHASFFPRLNLNYADCLLGFNAAGAEAPALSECHVDAPPLCLTRGELRARVASLAGTLERLGLRSGDRVAMIMRNDAQAVVSTLAVAALGATVASAAPEMGADALLDRFSPLAPRLLFAHTATRTFDRGTPPADNIASLTSAMPSLEGIISLDDGPLPDNVTLPVHSLGALIAQSDPADFVWRRFPFNHPLFIMFSSGTTGKPKCIVHGAGGTLLEHLKEHRLHTDLHPGDKLYFQTSCAWMMWNWQLSALASGVEVITYDGPLSTVDTLWRLAAQQRANVFGTSPAYLKMCEQVGLEPAQQFDLSALRAVLSTGAVLFDSQYDWVREHVGPLPLQSISGGTDIVGCFVLGNPNLPVYAGEAQCRSLGLDVQAWKDGKPAVEVGHLVCTNPFPSRPLGFFGDADGARFHASYFAANPGVWTHGDLIELTPRGSARLHGRVDGVLNVGGVNVGPAEIYRILNDIPGIQEAMVVDSNTGDASPNAGRHRANAMTTDGSHGRGIVLLLVLQSGVELSAALQSRVRRDLVRRGSASHVPDLILAVDALPTTHSGKPSEAAARDALNGLPARNAAALRNPECLDAIRRQTSSTEAASALPSPGNTREQMESYLRALWERMFGFGPIDRDDNFFDLGGDSLLASEMATHIHETSGCTLSFANLMAAPTIAQIADILEAGPATATSGTLVLMRTGSGTPLILAHSVTGSVMECRALIGALRTERPVYGLNAQGLDGEGPLQLHVVEMARAYLAQIRRLQPHGPYALAGYSFGGLIALEIAQQLHRAGEPIELLCLLDTHVSEHFLPWNAWMRYETRYVAQQWRTFRDMSPAQRIRYMSAKVVGAMDRLRLRLGYQAHRAEPNALGLPPMLLRVRKAMQVAMATYRPKRYSAGPILYVRALIRTEGPGDPLPLWRRVARGGLKVIDVAAGHSDMIASPKADTVAAALDAALSLSPSHECLVSAGELH
ncbi:acetoacetyl-CoA synthetase [Paraburkholderia sp. GAS333]|uniref:acetoacetate--CoA ligase n=1 Tax=Paraburkholderia sp. GAS333 TaxID=3156279 RepID=UPI003D242B80